MSQGRENRPEQRKSLPSKPRTYAVGQRKGGRIYKNFSAEEKNYSQKDARKD